MPSSNSARRGATILRAAAARRWRSRFLRCRRARAATNWPPSSVGELGSTGASVVGRAGAAAEQAHDEPRIDAEKIGADDGHEPDDAELHAAATAAGAAAAVVLDVLTLLWSCASACAGMLAESARYDTRLVKSGLPIDEILPALRTVLQRAAQCRRGSAARRRQEHRCSDCAARRTVVARRQNRDARAAPARDARGGDAHGDDAGRIARRNRGLPHAPRDAREQAHAHRSRHRGRVHAHAAKRSGARRRGRRVVRRVPRAQPARRHGPGVRARFAGEPVARPAAAGDVRDAGRRRRRQVVRRRAGGHGRGPRVPGRDPLRRAAACRCCRVAAMSPELGVVRAIKRALAEAPGDMLVFLPGAGEIRRVQGMLAGVGSDVDVLPLFGELAAGDQDAALRPAKAGRRKIVLATNIAETSLTIDGVRIVVDAGLERRSLFDPASGMNRLEVQRISRASAEQRAGRAGRTAPGVCLPALGRGRGAQPRRICAARSVRRRSRAAGAGSRGVGNGSEFAALARCAARRHARQRARSAAPARRAGCRRQSDRARPRHAGISRASAARAHAAEGARARGRLAGRGARRAAVRSRPAARGRGRQSARARQRHPHAARSAAARVGGHRSRRARSRAAHAALVRAAAGCRGRVARRRRCRCRACC